MAFRLQMIDYFNSTVRWLDDNNGNVSLQVYAYNFLTIDHQNLSFYHIVNKHPANFKILYFPL
jgi:hypothetical protein